MRDWCAECGGSHDRMGRCEKAALYIAASYSKDRLRAKAFIARCKEAGFRITHDWTDEVPPPPGTAESDRHAAHRRQAEEDLVGAREAAVLVLLYSDGMRGAWIEVGAACVMGNDVLIVGADIEHFLFFFLPNVHRVANEDEALAWLEARS